MKTLFYLPLIIYNMLLWFVPFNKESYKPSGEDMRLSEQALRNKTQLTKYKAKLLIIKRRK